MGEARAKWQYAHADLERLVSEIRAWPERNPCDVLPEIDFKTRQKVFRFVILQNPPTDWSLRMSHIANDLRSALNYAISAVASPATEDNSFPIDRVEAEYRAPGQGKRSRGRLSRRDRYLVNVPEPIRAIVDGYQPYNRGNDADSDPLARLAYLSNTDKHAQLPVAYATYRQQHTIVHPVTKVEYFDAIYYNVGIPLYHGVELVRITVRPLDAKLAVEGRTMIEIAFGERRISTADVVGIERHVIEIIERLSAALVS